MSVTLHRAGADDRPAILRLMDEARGEHLNDEERAQQGFVQGQMDESTLARIQAGPGVFVACDGPILAGFAMTSTASAAGSGLAVETAKVAAKVVPELSLDKIFLYGPVVVDRRYQGQGLLTRLLVHVCIELRAQFSLGALFIDRANQKSLAIHRHYPMDERASFEFKKRSYVVFTFSPAKIGSHLGSERG